MALKSYNPTSPARRGLVLVDRSGLHKGKPVKALTEGLTKSGGRNNKGHATARGIGGGHKQKYRIIDFKRRRFDAPAMVERLEYDPNRSAFIALVKYEDGQQAYIIAPQRLAAGDVVVSMMFLVPFQVTVLGMRVPLPDWIKATFGFSLPVMANVAEIVRGAVRSVPTTQWEAAESLAFTRRQILWRIILPQCAKRMLPPWMNVYALIAMATVQASIVGVTEMLTLTAQVHAAEGGRPELFAPLYGFALLCFFFYCYPIDRLTARLERRFETR